MPHISRHPLPSIALVLTTDHTRVPRRPSVIKYARRAAPVPAPAPAPAIDSVKKAHLVEEASEFKSKGDLSWEVDLGEAVVVHHDDDSSMYTSRGHGHGRDHTLTTLEDEDDDMELATSIFEVPVAEEQERFVVVKMIKEKLSDILFSFRRLLCVDLPHTCFPGVTRN